MQMATCDCGLLLLDHNLRNLMHSYFHTLFSCKIKRLVTIDYAREQIG